MNNRVVPGNANSVMESRVWNREGPRDGEERVKRGGAFRFMVLGVSFVFNHLVAVGTRLGKKEESLLKRGEYN